MTFKPPKSLTADIILLIATLFWGSSFVAVKMLVSTMPIYQLIILRFGIATLLLLPFVYPQLRKLNRTSLLPGIWVGFTLFAGFSLQTAAMKYTTATQAAFLTALSVLMVPIFLIFIQKTVVSPRLWLCVLLALVGLSLLSLNAQWQLNFGDILAILCAISFALHIIYTTIYTLKYHPLFILWIQFVTVTIFSGIISLVLIREPWVVMSINQWFGVGYLMLFVTIGCYLVQVYFQKMTDTTRAGLIYALEPVFAAIFAYLLLRETLPLRGWIGAGLIFAALIISEMKRKPTEEPKNERTI
ncbi:MAG: DMT family transporter [bacterium]|nr:DMT family transporter [bacterium]